MTSWPFSTSSPAIERPTAPAPAMATRISRPRRPRSAAAPAIASASGMSPRRRSHVDQVTVLETVFGVGQHARAEPDRRTPPGRRSRPRARPAAARSSPGGGQLDEPTVPEGSRHSVIWSRGQHAQQPVGGPRHGGHGRDAEPLVDLGALGVVDAGDDVLDAELLAGHPGGDDVGVVAAEDTAANASASSMPACSRTSRSKPIRSPAGRGTRGRAGGTPRGPGR